MKKIIRNFLILLSLLLSTSVIVPWNNMGQWGIDIPILQEQEVYIKGGIGVLLFIISFVYLLISCKEYKKSKALNKGTAYVAFLPLYMFLISTIAYTFFIFYNVVYSYDPNPLTLMKVGFFAVLVMLFSLYGHVLISDFRKAKNGRRFVYFSLVLILTGISTYFAYWMKTWGVTQSQYTNMNTSLLFYIPLGTLSLYVLHMILMLLFKRKPRELEAVDMNQNNYTDSQPSKQSNATIVAPEQPIVSSKRDLDPTNVVYEDVNVDPEFTSSKGTTKANSIEYYIEKPKMFKALDPTFDQLVEYVRGLPQVVTKLDDDKITFYVDRKPFIVLMNFGNYYRLAFKYDLEKGIRLIIKYPTISKNKSTRDELWFKANNYGDIPKDVIFGIVKTSYDSINL